MNNIVIDEMVKDLKEAMLKAMRNLASEGVAIKTGEGGASEFFEFVRDNKFDENFSISAAADMAEDVFLENYDEIVSLYN
jgi:hypothetical protein